MVAVNGQQITALPGSHETERDFVFGQFSQPGLPVIVLHTTEEGTLAALKAAGTLARNLSVRVGLAVIEVVPFRLPLERPPVPVDFLKRQQCSLLSKAGIEAEEVRIQICLCRDRDYTLSRLLAPQSLVLVGGRSGGIRERSESWRNGSLVSVITSFLWISRSIIISKSLHRNTD